MNRLKPRKPMNNNLRPTAITQIALALSALLSTLNPQLSTAFAQGTAFTYQGQLNDGANPATGAYDLVFTVYGAASGGSAVGGPLTNSATVVSNGLFAITLDFGNSPFSAGAQRWLEIAARTNGVAAFTTLSPRQKFLATPYAITAGNFTGTVGNGQLANNSITVGAGTGLSGGGAVPLGGSTTLSNAGVLSVTGNSDITATTVSGAVSLGDTATDTDTPGTIVKRDVNGDFSTADITLDYNLYLPATTASAGIIYSGGTPFIHRYGSLNMFAGLGAGNLTMSGQFNTGVGSSALANNTSGNGNSAYGDNALVSNASGSHNTAVGLDALASNVQPSDNTAIGAYALQNNTSGTWNTAVGFESLSFNTNGSSNAALGYDALADNRSGNNNTAAGMQALMHNTTGANNTATGTAALVDNVDSWDNTADGESALSGVTTGGGENTAVGAFAAYTITTGSGNIAIGVDAGDQISTGNNNIDIGNTGFGNESDTIRIGTSQTKAVMLGIYGMTIATGGTPVYVNPSGLLGTSTSSERFKQNIRKMGDTSDELLALHPVTFQYKPEIDPNGTPQYGLVAEQVAKVDPNLVVYDGKGQIYSVRYEAVNAMLLNEFLKEHKRVEEQNTDLQNLKRQNDALKNRLDNLEQMVKSLGDKN